MQIVILNKDYILHSIMERKIHLLQKPAAGAARIEILYRFPPWKSEVQKFDRGSVLQRASKDGGRRSELLRASGIDDRFRENEHRASTIGHPKFSVHRASELHRASGIDHRLCFLINATKKSWKKHHLSPTENTHKKHKKSKALHVSFSTNQTNNLFSAKIKSQKTFLFQRNE